MSDQISFILGYVHYTKTVMLPVMRFLVIPPVGVISEATRSDYFYWYVNGV